VLHIFINFSTLSNGDYFMNIKTFIATAVVALTLAACTAEEPAPTVTVEEAVSQESANVDVGADNEIVPPEQLPQPK
jgi:PBP1b-binding outer membrane lipoprotein LpoB